MVAPASPDDQHFDGILAVAGSHKLHVLCTQCMLHTLVLLYRDIVLHDSLIYSFFFFLIVGFYFYLHVCPLIYFLYLLFNKLIG